jgi:hypothetical protein
VPMKSACSSTIPAIPARYLLSIPTHCTRPLATPLPSQPFTGGMLFFRLHGRGPETRTRVTQERAEPAAAGKMVDRWGMPR